MIRPGFIVEGDLEYEVIKKLCPKCPTPLLGINGNDVELEAIAKHIGTQARILESKYCNPIIVILDREGRKETSDEIICRLHRALEGQDLKSKIIIGVPDRMIENWILADLKTLRRSTGISKRRCKINYEGVHGKEALKKILPPKIRYRETIEGACWLARSVSRTIYQNSASFKTFADKLRNIPCPWVAGCRS